MQFIRRQTLTAILFTIGLFLLSALSTTAQKLYFPERRVTWESRDAAALGLNKQAIDSAVEFAKANEYSGSRDLRIAILNSFQHEPYISIVGPVKHRGGPAGLIIKNGYIVAQWGDIKRVDMTFSVTKSYLSTVAGLAVDNGLIRNVDDKVADYVWDGTFRGEHNARITWRALLTQSSDWSGTLFGKKDWADRPPKAGDIDEWKYRKLHAPGTHFKYNDVRVNVLAYALLQLWRKPLPQVLKEKIMDPIGASSTWRWFGYKTSWVNVDGTWVQSVSGGGHSGGGVFINTLDQARFGLLFMRNGNWNGRQLISARWIKAVRQPSQAFKSYGFMWWLNQGPRHYEGVPKSMFYAAGFGGNYIIVDQENNLLIVTRWLQPAKLGEFLKILYKGI